ncbi:MAG: tyrosine--tRNA ligase [Rothia sp. (in: high G+C Gram-positive bacteria)]|nr:tyrosine--tRNA ligase [Rothia sp. (in: high G+C Gram-positive bacteria)]
MSEETLAAQHNDDSFQNIWQELKWRGFVHVSTDEEALEKALAEETVNFYIGYDPTAASLHLGHLVQLLLMRRLQLAGHRPFGLVGGATGLIGDPRQTSERVLNSRDVVEGWVARLRAQIERFLSFEGENGAQMVNNLDWTSELSAIDFLREIGKNFRVGTMIKKEIVAKRLNSEEGISYTEFSYQILQGNDFLELNRRHNVTLQCGGSDQWGNLTSGTELVRKVTGQSVHALGTPLITNSDGTKFGKSEGNAIWLDPQMCSPYAFYQFWLNTADADVADRLKVFTFKTRDEIAALQKSVEEEPFKRLAQKTLAYEVTALVHGVEATEKVIAASEALFGKGDFASLDEATLQAATAELPHAVLSADQLDLVTILTETGLSSSKSEARRTLKEGGAAINNVKVQGEDAVLTEADLLLGKYAVVRRGKKNMALLELA